MNKNTAQDLADILRKHFDELQNQPDQYVIGIYNVLDETLIGYHLSTVCQVTDDILEAKRYSGLEPYEQIMIIHKNISSLLALTEEELKDKMFGTIQIAIRKERYEGIGQKDFYLDAIYMNPNIPKQSFRYVVMEP
mgnify:CR=1